MESAVSGRRVEQAALTAKEHRLESLCAQRSFTPLFREEWREYKTAQRVSTRWCTGHRLVFLYHLTKKIEISPNKYWTKAESRIYYVDIVFCVLRLPSPSERRDLGNGQSVSRCGPSNRRLVPCPS